MRRIPPPSQVLEALSRAKRDRLPFGLAWHLAIHGQVCDSYASRRRDATEARKRRAPRGSGPPPRLRPADGFDGSPRCGGCKHFAAGECAVYGQPVYGGVEWPTDSSADWRDAIADTKHGWEAAYEGRATEFTALAAGLEPSDGVEDADVIVGTVAA